MKRNYWWVVSWVLLWAVFFVKGVWMLDPDLGWHLRMGETIVKSGIPLTDPFSYTVPDFPAVGNEWLNNVVEYGIYNKWGKVGLAVVWTGMAVGAVALAGGSVVPTLLAAGTLVGLGGVRAQVIDWLMLMVTVRIWQKRRWVIPILFGVWANLHGAFVLGPVVVGVLMGVKLWQRRKIDWGDAGVWVVGVAATLVNPWGIRLWEEVWSQVGNTGIRWTVAEWQPFWLATGWMGVVMLAVGAAMLWWKFGDRKLTGQAAVAGVLGVMAMGGVRHTALFALAAIPVMADGLAGFERAAWQAKDRWKKFYKLLLMVGVVTAGVETGVGLWFGWQLREEKFYPKTAMEWIKENGVSGRMFTDYGWGGYLGWKMPEEKVFIDGRMATWKAKDSSIFDTYLAVVNGKEDFGPVFEKYGVGTVIWPKREKSKFPRALEERGWQKAYEDRTSLVYKKI